MRRILERISYHAVYDDSILDALAFAKSHGFAGVQVAVEAPHLSFESLPDAECEKIASFRAEHRLSVCLHAPDDATSLFTFSRYLREGVFDYFEALLAFAEKIRAKLVTVHPGSMVGFGTHTEPAERIPRSDRSLYRRVFAENLARLVDLARDRTILCAEYWQADPIITESLQPHLEAGDLALCWDLAKTFTRGVEFERYFRDHLDYVRQVHLHDVSAGLSHRVIGSGEIDFMSYLPRLADADVLDYVIEVRPREKAEESLASLRGLIEGSTP